MTQPIPMEMNFLAAMLHGRRSRLAEDGRLDELCRIRTVGELARVLYPGETIESAFALQRRMVAGLMEELRRLAGSTEQDERSLLPWLRVRFQIENLKVLVRGRSTGAALETLEPYMVPLSRDLSLDAPKLLAAESTEAFFKQLPNSILCRRIRSLDEACLLQPGTFHLEAALDHAYLGELLFRAEGVVGDDRLSILAAIQQEVDIFHLMLVVRGKFGYGLAPDTLAALHVRGSSGRAAFTSMLAASDLEAVAEKAVGRMMDTRPKTADPAELEMLAWNRLFRLANKAFRQGHMGMGAVIGYTMLRRVELANLITLCEGIRTGADPRALRARLIPRTAAEGSHV